MPDSEDEAEEPPAPACLTASQAVVDGLLAEAAPGGGAGSGGSASTQRPEAWQEEPVLRGPAAVTLLLPRDARGELGLDSRRFALPGRQASAGALLALVHSYYAEQVRLMLCEAWRGL